MTRSLYIRVVCFIIPHSLLNVIYVSFALQRVDQRNRNLFIPAACIPRSVTISSRTARVVWMGILNFCYFI
jgi:hypothetical protein